MATRRFPPRLTLLFAVMYACAPGRTVRPDAALRACVPTSGAVALNAAVDCAQRFLARNGYTDSFAGVPAAITLETIENDTSVAAIVQARRGTLEPRAAAVCEGSTAREQFVVGFRYRLGSDTTIGRAVTMTRDFTDMRVQHRDFSLAAARAGQFGCRAL